MTAFTEKFKPNSALNGDVIYHALLDVLPDSIKNTDDAKLASFKALLRQAAYDHTASQFSRTSTPDEFERTSYRQVLRNYIAQSGVNNISEVADDTRNQLAKSFLLKSTTIYPHTRNQTPHPTETLSKQAIDAQAHFNAFLEDKLESLFRTGEIPGDALADYQREVQAFYETLEPPESSFSVRDEMYMNIRQSRAIYDSVVDHYKLLAEAVEKELGYDFSNGIPENVREWLFKAAAASIRNETWSPGDADSKPHMRPALLQKGLRMGRLAIRQQYMWDLAELASQLEDKPDSANAVNEIKALVWSLFDDVEHLYLGNEESGKEAEAQLARFINDYLPRDGASPEAIRFIQNIYDIYYEPLNYNQHSPNIGWWRLVAKKEAAGHPVNDVSNPNSTYLRAINVWKEKKEAQLASLANHTHTPASDDNIFPDFFYHIDPNLRPDTPHTPITAEEERQTTRFGKGFPDIMMLEKRLETLSKDPVVALLTQPDSHVPQIDTLRAQIASYKGISQRVTHRQTKKVYQSAMDNILSIIAYQDSPLLQQLSRAGFKPEQPGSFDVKDLINVLTSDDPAIKLIADDLRRNIRKLTKNEMITVRTLQDQMDQGLISHLEPLEQLKIDTFESLEMLRIGMYSNGDVATELIAEAATAQDMWNLMALQQLMIDPEHRPDLSQMPRIVPLVEYTEHIKDLPKTLKEAFSFKPFAHLQKQIQPAATPPWLQMWDEGTQDLRDMTMQDLIDQAVATVDDKAGQQRLRSELEVSAKANIQKWQTVQSEPVLNDYPVFHYIAMGAGSDSTKSSGSAFVTAFRKAFKDADKEMVEFGGLLTQYVGNGSSLHRNAVTNALIRTRQGREMWRGSESLTSETAVIRSQHFAQRFISGQQIPAGGEAMLPYAAVTNLGNRANLYVRANEDDAMEIAERNEARVNQYVEYYDTDDLAAFLEIATPRELCGVYKYAARPAFRLTKTADKDFSVGDLRAIMYGFAQNASGFGAPHLWLGLSEHVLGITDEKPLTDETRRLNTLKLYLKDPYGMQDQLNRARDNLLLRSPEDGWRNVFAACGLKQEPVRRVDANGEIVLSIGALDLKLSELVNDKPHSIEQVLDTLNPGKNGADRQKAISAIRTAALLDLEGEKALRGIAQLHEDLVACAPELTSYKKLDKLTSRNLKAALTDLQTNKLQESVLSSLDVLSPSLSSELREMRETAQWSIKGIGHMFREIKVGDRPMPLKMNKIDEMPDDDAKQRALQNHREGYFFVKPLMDVTECVASAYYSPGHAVAVAANQNHITTGVAAAV